MVPSPQALDAPYLVPFAQQDWGTGMFMKARTFGRAPWRRGGIATLALLLVVTLAAPSSTRAATLPTKDSFYNYSGSTPLKDIKPGTVLKTRSLSYHFLGIPLPLTVVQLLFRTTNAVGQPSVSVTSVVRPPGAKSTKVLSYQSFYDSLNPNDEPSYAISGGVSVGGFIPNAELPIFSAFLFEGYNIIVPDTEGETADFSAGPEYGMDTLDSIRAALHSSANEAQRSPAKVGMIGYSGGAIATGWAAALAPTYAPDVNSHLVGAAEGGILVDPDHNLHYINGSVVWAGVAVMSIIGLARAYHVDIRPYLSSYGLSLYNEAALGVDRDRARCVPGADLGEDRQDLPMPIARGGPGIREDRQPDQPG